MLLSDTDVKYVKGVGPKVSRILNRLNINTVEDLLLHTPSRYVDRGNIKEIREVKKGETVTLVGTILDVGSRLTRARKTIIEILFSDGTGNIKLVFFNQLYIKNTLKRGEHLLVYGVVDFYRGYQIIQPEYEILGEDGREIENSDKIVPVYPLTEGLSQRYLRKIIHNALINIDVDRWKVLENDLLSQFDVISFIDAIRKTHNPPVMEDAIVGKKALAFYEFLYLQVYLRKQRYIREKKSGAVIEGKILVNKLLKNLPFVLTNAQEKVTDEIFQDLKSSERMSRLLQGDVGSGKTIVALLASLAAIDSDYQVAIMAPTEILAKQHYGKIVNYISGFQVNIRLLTSSTKKSEKIKIKDDLKNAKIKFIIGTHALIEDDVVFESLALAIVDEQHRFGVEQRKKLLMKGNGAHLLVMTATPIPRSLAMTLYGDLDVSIIDEMPPGRQKIVTRWIRNNKRGELYSFIKNRIDENNDQVYVVYPLVEESEKLDLKAATVMYESLKKHFKGINVGLIHGKMKSADKDAAMIKFAKGEINILVGTTVIEVGIDVANATIMVIEHPERFGLSQLHQLRGRIGRGEKKSYCIMITDKYIGDLSAERLKIMENTSDGFIIAEEDLKIRGPGNVYGTRQHGLPNFRVADIVRDEKMLIKARKCAKLIIDSNIELNYNTMLYKKIDNMEKYYRIG